MEIVAGLKVIGYAIAAAGCGLGISKACCAACEASARQPELQGKLFTNFIIGAALIEALALICFVLALIAQNS